MKLLLTHNANDNVQITHSPSAALLKMKGGFTPLMTAIIYEKEHRILGAKKLVQK